MSAEQIVEWCWWYLEHVHLFLIPAAIFDVICWIAIAIYLTRRRVTRPSKPSPFPGSPTPPRSSSTSSQSEASIKPGDRSVVRRVGQVSARGFPLGGRHPGPQVPLAPKGGREGTGAHRSTAWCSPGPCDGLQTGTGGRLHRVGCGVRAGGLHRDDGLT